MLRHRSQQTIHGLQMVFCPFDANAQQLCTFPLYPPFSFLGCTEAFDFFANTRGIYAAGYLANLHCVYATLNSLPFPSPFFSSSKG